MADEILNRINNEFFYVLASQKVNEAETGLDSSASDDEDSSDEPGLPLKRSHVLSVSGPIQQGNYRVQSMHSLSLIIGNAFPQKNSQSNEVFLNGGRLAYDSPINSSGIDHSFDSSDRSLGDINRNTFHNGSASLQKFGRRLNRLPLVDLRGDSINRNHQLLHGENSRKVTSNRKEEVPLTQDNNRADIEKHDCTVIRKPALEGKNSHKSHESIPRNAVNNSANEIMDCASIAKLVLDEADATHVQALKCILARLAGKKNDLDDLNFEALKAYVTEVNRVHWPENEKDLKLEFEKVTSKSTPVLTQQNRTLVLLCLCMKQTMYSKVSEIKAWFSSEKGPAKPVLLFLCKFFGLPKKANREELVQILGKGISFDEKIPRDWGTNLICRFMVTYALNYVRCKVGERMDRDIMDAQKGTAEDKVVRDPYVKIMQLVFQPEVKYELNDLLSPLGENWMDDEKSNLYIGAVPEIDNNFETTRTGLNATRKQFKEQVQELLDSIDLNFDGLPEELKQHLPNVQNPRIEADRWLAYASNAKELKNMLLERRKQFIRMYQASGRNAPGGWVSFLKNHFNPAVSLFHHILLECGPTFKWLSDTDSARIKGKPATTWSKLSDSSDQPSWDDDCNHEADTVSTASNADSTKRSISSATTTVENKRRKKGRNEINHVITCKIEAPPTSVEMQPNNVVAKLFSLLSGSEASETLGMTDASRMNRMIEVADKISDTQMKLDQCQNGLSRKIYENLLQQLCSEYSKLSGTKVDVNTDAD